MHQKENAKTPTILYEGKNTLADLEELKVKEKIWEISDIYEKQVRELFEITNAPLMHSPDYTKKEAEFVKEKVTIKGSKLNGNWIYFPWSGVLLHTVNEKEYYSLRTNRNKNLITLEEQEKLSRATLGMVGLSIGNSMALTMLYNGIGNTIKLAEYDTLDTSNLNRIRVRMDQVGSPKISVTEQQIYEINPYAKIFSYTDGLTEDNISDYVTGDPKPTVIFEAVDDFVMKIRIRMVAREAGIPVIMLTNIGDNILIDVERYDKEPKLPIFNGLIGSLGEEILDKPITEEDKHRYAVELVGKENVPERALQSIQEIGKTLVGRPQLIGTISASSGIAAYLARKIILDETLTSGRRVIKLPTIID